MALPAGTRLGSFVLDGLVGEGGMGSVYRARDTRLDRTVALKFVLEAFTADADRTAQFEQEARTLAALNHPNIAALHGLEALDGRHILVMEYVDGETLAERIARYPSGMPLDEALDIARQVASGLEAAHEQGIIHRDLKPSNVRITPGDRAKVLDFGLAKTVSRPASADMMNSPTITAESTELGVILGTAAYMAPEQARGKTVDRRADVWAFGVVLFEMLTGKRLFHGENTAELLAALLTQDPDFRRLPASVPANVRRVLRRCLERDPRRRLRDIGDARLELEAADASDDAGAPPLPAGRSRHAPPTVLRWVSLALAAALIVSLTALAAVWRGRPATTLPPSLEFDVSPLEGTSLLLSSRPAVAVSRDGAAIVFVASLAGESRLFVRQRDHAEIHEIPGTLGASNPAFSPDGQWIAYLSTSQVTKVSLDGRSRVELAPVVDPRGVAWLDNETLVFSRNVGSGLVIVPANGGPTRDITSIDRERGERSHRWPAPVPGGKAVLFTIGTESSPDDYSDASIDAVDVTSGRRHRVLDGASMVECTEDGRLVFMRRGVLYAVSLDSDRVETRGDPVELLPGIEGDATTGAGHFSISAEGTLAYVPGLTASGQRRLVWADRSGARTPIDIPALEYNEPALSADGKRLVVVVGTVGRADLWTYEFAGKAFTRLTFEGRAASPAWSRDGQSVYYAAIDPAIMQSQLMRKSVEGNTPAVPLVTIPGRVYLGYMDPQERFAIVMRILKGATANSDILRVPLQPPGEPQPLVATAANEYAPTVSPNGRWLAYASSSTGVQEVWVQDLDGTGRWQISTSGGIQPRWSPDGRELYYRRDTVQMAAPIDPSGPFRAGAARQLFGDVYNWRTEAGMNYTVDVPTGRFLFIEPPSAGDRGAPAVRVITNWRGATRRK